MKNIILSFGLLVVAFVIFSCEGEKREKFKEKVHRFGKYSYTTVSNDPTKTRIYTLENGLKVYLSVYKDAPRIQTYVAIGAGSKNDPFHATGLAHYLEHILFKGTSKIGTADWEKEKVLLDKIEALYETYRQTKDDAKRTKIYAEIDSISGVAAKFAIANEYDKIMSTIGAQGTNAYTFFEQTVYVNDIPSNQIENWAKTEAERFNEVVARLFHTELEAVYEEKNKGLDNDRRKVWEALMEGLFQKHTYGTQTTIGTIEHLKNPSITEIKKFFYTYYVPNNMAICLSGDLDPDATIEIISKHFGGMKAKEVPNFTAPVEEEIESPRVIDVFGPDAESITIGFRLPGGTTKEALVGELFSALLSNGQVGLIDINLNQKQKVLGAYSYFMRLKDYSVHMLGASPREGQTLEKTRDLLLAQIDSIKQGKFEDWLIQAILNNSRIAKMKELESNQDRADAYVTAFVLGQSWKSHLEEDDILSTLTKKDIMDFAAKFYDDNYVLVNKRSGKDENIQKVPKPAITPVTVNREDKTPFFQTIETANVKPIQPVFVDYAKDLTFSKTSKGMEITYKKNEENGLFNLYYVLDMGTLNEPKIALAASYLDYLGTEKFNAEELKKEFYKLACNYDVSSSEDKIFISLSGLASNMEKAMTLVEELIQSPKPDAKAYADMVDGILKTRENNKLNKGVILRGGMVNYAKFGPKNPFTTLLSEQELRNIKPEELTGIIQKLFDYPHRVLFYGPISVEKLASTIDQIHSKQQATLKYPEAKKFTEREIKQNEVYFVQYDMVQAEIVMLSSSDLFNKEMVPQVELFNQYFGGDMSSVVFQEIREARALAYAVRSRYSMANEKDKRNYMVSYIGTQADKLPEAVAAMEELFEKLPKSEQNLKTAKEAILKSIESERITKASVLTSFEMAKKIGVDYDLRRDVFSTLNKMDFETLENFRKKYVGGQPKAVLVLGDRNRLPFEYLQKKYGTVKELSLEDVFGY